MILHQNVFLANNFWGILLHFYLSNKLQFSLLHAAMLFWKPGQGMYLGSACNMWQTCFILSLQSEKLVLLEDGIAFMHSCFHWFSHPCIHRSFHFIHRSSHPSIHTSIHAFLQSCAHSCILLSTHAFLHSCTNSCIQQFIHPFMHDECIHACLHKFLHSPITSSIQ